MIGCGSDLRRDDAAGRHVAATVAAAGLPGVEARSVTQLVPELAADLAGRDLVVFVDADVGGDGVRVRPVAPAAGGSGTTHHMDPAGLLALAGILDVEVGEVVLVTVPAADLGLGEGLSPATRSAVEEATATVLSLCR